MRTRIKLDGKANETTPSVLHPELGPLRLPLDTMEQPRRPGNSGDKNLMVMSVVECF